MKGPHIGESALIADLRHLPQFWQNAYPNFTYDENDVWYDGFNSQATKDALLRLQQAYADGVIDPETLTMGTKDVREKWWAADLTKECNEFFSEHSIDAPRSASCDAITNYGGTITDARNTVISEVVVKGGDVDAAMANYVKATQDMVDEILGQLNAK